MLTTFSRIILLKIWTMDSNFKVIPYFNILQKFRSKRTKTKMTFYPELNLPGSRQLRIDPVNILKHIKSRNLVTSMDINSEGSRLSFIYCEERITMATYIAVMVFTLVCFSQGRMMCKF